MAGHQKEHSAAVMLDHQKFHDKVDIKKLCEVAHALQYPMALLVGGLDMTVGVRTLRLSKRLSEPILAATGILPGDGQAVSRARAYVFFPMKRMHMINEKMQTDGECCRLWARRHEA